jgi:SOS response regulatory protein OraA/RecX
MSPKGRAKAQRLETLLARHDAYEQRTLADLRAAGFTFTSIDAARTRLTVQRTLAGFTQSQITIAITAFENREKKRA